MSFSYVGSLQPRSVREILSVKSEPRINKISCITKCLARDRGIKLEAFKNMAQDRDHFRKWINGSTLKGNRES